MVAGRPGHAVAQLVNPFAMRHPDVKVHRRLPYAPGGMRFEADVYHHRDVPAGAPVLLQVHGGGWVIGRKEQQGDPADDADGRRAAGSAWR